MSEIDEARRFPDVPVISSSDNTNFNIARYNGTVATKRDRKQNIAASNPKFYSRDPLNIKQYYKCIETDTILNAIANDLTFSPRGMARAMERIPSIMDCELKH